MFPPQNGVAWPRPKSTFVQLGPIFSIVLTCLADPVASGPADQVPEVVGGVPGMRRRSARVIYPYMAMRTFAQPVSPSATDRSQAARLVLVAALGVDGPAGAADVRAAGRFMIPPIFRQMQLRNRGDHEPRTLARVQ
jgi:hypothetical protein